MTTVDILFAYTTPPTDSIASAVAGIKDVYGIRGIRFDSAARTVRIEYDATRLTAAAVAKLVLQTGLDVNAELPLIPPSPPEPVPAA